MTLLPPCEKSTKRCNKPSMNIINTKEHLGASRARKRLAQRKDLLILEVMLQSGRFLSALTCILHSHKLLINPFMRFNEFLMQLYSLSISYSAIGLVVPYNLIMDGWATKCSEAEEPVLRDHFH
jgi:hypothetical protein